ncbi:MAG: hypothetical protein IKK53_04550 [Ruminiclostridium sp.]|nr:hypothetical protein [Ruminiclostridium sp.]
MRNKNILKVLSLLAAVCITAGCNGSTAVETTTTTTTITAVECTTTVTTVAEITPSAEGTDSEISASSELEVDYVDEYGRKRYKNPTIWTTEKIFEELTINDQKFEAPLTLEKLGEGYSYSLDGAFYDEETRTACLRLMYNDKSLAYVYLDDCNDLQDTFGKQFNCILFSLNSTSEEYRDDVSISGLNIGDDANDIIVSIGIPNESTADKEWFSYGDYNDNITLNVIQDNGKVIYIGVDLIIKEN